MKRSVLVIALLICLAFTTTTVMAQEETPTVTPQPSPTPDLSYNNIPLESGNTFVIERRISYGDIAVVIALMITLLIQSVYIIVRGAKLWLR
jgi:hypothetical protein